MFVVVNDDVTTKLSSWRGPVRNGSKVSYVNTPRIILSVNITRASDSRHLPDHITDFRHPTPRFNKCPCAQWDPGVSSVNATAVV